nr:hypothetical protein [Tanacetum cinerariifolium]
MGWMAIVYCSKYLSRRRMVQKETTRSQKPAGHRPHGPSMNPRRPNMNENFPTITRKFPTASRKFTTGSTKITLLIWEGKEKLAVPRTTLMTKVIGTVAALGT